VDELLPTSTVPGFVPTLNATGWMTLELDEVSRAFVTFAAQSGSECLDIGCAYGVATLPALAAGARVLASDLELRHLQILEQRTPPEDRARLRTRQGAMPEIDFSPASFGAILSARALHFLRGPDVTRTVANMARWLEPGGRLFLVMDSPYGGPWARRAPEYERRKAAGDPWPAYVADFRELLPSDAPAANHPPFINPMDPDILRREVTGAGLQVLQCCWLPGFDTQRTPNIRCGVIAMRPGGGTRTT
jgi:SAM-dependent methyltransferase